MAASRYRCTSVVPEPVDPVPRMVDPRDRAVASSTTTATSRAASARAAVFGVSATGSCRTSSLILGVAGADPEPGVVRLAGLAGLIAGAVSMAAGEYVSMRAQTELLERELDLERRELRRNPHVETVELAQIYQSPRRASPTGPGRWPRR